jgi:NAD(P)H-hydrate repair Nnr-like enzyme with NAD(P)H-hydrate dehydratase domain
MRVWSYAFGLFFVALGVLFGVFAYLDEPPGAAVTFWIMAASFAGSGLLVVAVARSANRMATRTVEQSFVVSSLEPDALEPALRQALALKGVTGALQDEAVEKALAAAAAAEAGAEPDRTHVIDAGAAPEQAPDPVEQLERLAKLRDSGVISEGEFVVAKAKLLNEL